MLIESSSATIGIEITWAANQQWEETQAYLGNTRKPAFDRVSRNWVESTRGSGKLLGRVVQAKQLESVAWHPKDQAAAKAREVVNALRRKENSLNKPGNLKLQENWLLVSDKLPFLFIELDEFVEVIKNLIDWNKFQHDALYFVTQVLNRTRREAEDVLWQFSESHLQVIGQLPVTASTADGSQTQAAYPLS